MKLATLLLLTAVMAFPVQQRPGRHPAPKPPQASTGEWVIRSIVVEGNQVYKPEQVIEASEYDES